VKRAALLVAALAFLAGCGSAEPTTTDVRKAVEARLVGKSLSFEWVYCLRTEREFDDYPIFRCNVNFGEPHIVIYCAIIDEGSLVTNREKPAIRCGREAAG
jgi:hypothetical protein